MYKKLLVKLLILPTKFRGIDIMEPDTEEKSI